MNSSKDYYLINTNENKDEIIDSNAIKNVINNNTNNRKYDILR